jgi:hypothetical protein
MKQNFLKREEICLKSFEASPVLLVRFSPYLSSSREPEVFEYNNPGILSLTPSEKRNDGYYDLRTGEKVVKDDCTQEWPILTGAVFRYPDKKQFLVSRSFTAKREFLFLEIEEFNPETMVYHEVR